jgi:glycosyltransferase involved in cell wall biosynthesis
MTRPSKIAFVTGGLQFGGSTIFLLNLATGLKTLGIASAAFSFNRANPFAADFDASEIPAFTVDETSLIIEDRMAALYRKLAEFKPATVIANIGKEAYEMFRYLPKGVKRIGMIHDLAMEPQRLLAVYEDVLDGVVVVNSHLLQDIRRIVPQMKSSYLAHGIRTPNQPPRSANPSGPLKLIYFGRLDACKGTRLFPEIIAALRVRKVPFQWTMHGSGPDEDWLRNRLAPEIAAGEVVLSSKVTQHELYSLVRQHDIFIMASDMEGGPLTLLEAMSLGLVPVCNEIPCMIQEVITPENGFRIPRTSEAYAESIAALNRDRSKLEQMSAAARNTITARYTSEAMAERYVEFIDSLGAPQELATWPARIKPMPMRGLSAVTQMTQRVGLVRQARRVLKRLNSKSG